MFFYLLLPHPHICPLHFWILGNGRDQKYISVSVFYNSHLTNKYTLLHGGFQILDLTRHLCEEWEETFSESYHLYVSYN